MTSYGHFLKFSVFHDSRGYSSIFPNLGAFRKSKVFLMNEGQVFHIFVQSKVGR